jgi:hypothetical protein
MTMIKITPHRIGFCGFPYPHCLSNGYADDFGPSTWNIAEAPKPLGWFGSCRMWRT